jgi:Putative amidoligase enzyme
MRLHEIFNKNLDEVSMSPSALTDFAKTALAQRMTAGFEAEFIVPNGIGDDSPEFEPDYDKNQRCRDFEDFEDFFDTVDGPSIAEIKSTRQKLEEEFFDYAHEILEEEFLDEKEKLIKRKMKEDDLTDEEIDQIISDEGREYEKYEEAARAEFMDDANYDDYIENFFRKNYPYMSDIASSFDLSWPYFMNMTSMSADLYQIASDISNTIGMPVKFSKDYHTLARGKDYFILEPDISIAADESEGEAGLELVSPPMPLAQCLEYMAKVFRWANREGCRTDGSTGFHMGISIPNQTMDNVDHLKFILFLGDEYVLQQFGRESNTYAKSMLRLIHSHAKSLDQSGANLEVMLNKFKQGLNSEASKVFKEILTRTTDRYVTVNIKSNYIEVRSAGGNYLDDLEKIRMTLLRYVRALGLAADPQAEKQEYAKKLYKLLSPLIQKDNNDTIKYFSQYSTGTLPSTALKSFVRSTQQQRDIIKRSKGTGPGKYMVVDKDGDPISQTNNGMKIEPFEANNLQHAIEMVMPWIKQGSLPNDATVIPANQINTGARLY